jgi:hypothetical protein
LPSGFEVDGLPKACWKIASLYVPAFGIGDHTIIIGIGGIFNFRISEYAMSHVKPAVRPPREAIEQLMPVFQTEASHENGSLVRFIIAIGILKKQKMRRLPNVHAAIADQNAGSQIESVRENRDLVRAPIPVSVFEDLDVVARLGS